GRDVAPAELLARRLPSGTEHQNAVRVHHDRLEQPDPLNALGQLVEVAHVLAVPGADSDLVDGERFNLHHFSAALLSVLPSPNYSDPTPEGSWPGASCSLGTPFRLGPASGGHRPLSPRWGCTTTGCPVS